MHCPPPGARESEGTGLSLRTHPSHLPYPASPAAGRLIFELGGIPERELEKLKEEAARLGKSSFAFAFYMDTQKEERARGVTIACTTKEFFTEKYHYTIIDAPGGRTGGLLPVSRRREGGRVHVLDE